MAEERSLSFGFKSAVPPAPSLSLSGRRGLCFDGFLFCRAKEFRLVGGGGVSAITLSRDGSGHLCAVYFCGSVPEENSQSTLETLALSLLSVTVPSLSIHPIKARKASSIPGSPHFPCLRTVPAKFLVFTSCNSSSSVLLPFHLQLLLLLSMFFRKTSRFFFFLSPKCLLRASFLHVPRVSLLELHGL